MTNKSNMQQIAVYLEADVKQHLDILADARKEAPEALAAEAIKSFLERAENLTPAEQAAVESWEHYKATGLHVTMSEADIWLAELEGGKDSEPPSCHR